MTTYCRRCIVINSSKDIFYGKLAFELKKEMKQLGYNFDCPDFLPKTVIDFTYTNIYYAPKRNSKRKIDKNIGLVGDCSKAYDIDFLREYDFLLPVTEYSLGYIAMFNFKAIHFPIKDRPFDVLCAKQYGMENINMKNVANHLHDIIQRIEF